MLLGRPEQASEADACHREEVIVGIGVDIVNVPKFGATLRAAPGFASTFFTPRESVDESGAKRSESSLAARFAAKEALAKALGVPRGIRWHDCEVLSGPHGEPYLETRGELEVTEREMGIDSWHLSMSAEGDLAVAYVVAEGPT